MTDKLDRWIQDTVREYGTPNGFPMDMLYSTDHSARKAASWALYYALKHGEEKKDSGIVHLVPQRTRDGGFQLVDKYKGYVVASVERTSDGMFSFSGPKEYITMFGGRGEWGELMRKMSDGDYFNN